VLLIPPIWQHWARRVGTNPRKMNTQILLLSLAGQAIWECSKELLKYKGAGLLEKFGHALLLRVREGTLPQNHDLDQALRRSLANSARVLAHTIHEPDRSPLAELIAHGNVAFLADRLAEMVRNNIRSEAPSDDWLVELIKESKKADAFSDFALGIDLAGIQLSSLLDEKLNQRLRDHIHEEFLAWCGKHVTVSPNQPSSFRDFVRKGWPLLGGGGRTITLYEVFCLFFREELKQNEPSFRALTVTTLASLRGNMAEALANAPSAEDRARWEEAMQRVGSFANFREFLTAQDAKLLSFLREEFDKLHGRFDQVEKTLGQIVGQIKKPAPAILHRLSTPIADFTGREQELANLREKLQTGGVLITALRGTGGVGKTQLARKLADELKGRFDLAVEIDLRGASKEAALTPAQALEQLIRSAYPGADGLPGTVEELGALWQDCLKERKALLLLDNARDPFQVRPLLPNTGGHVVLLTSRSRFSLARLNVLDLAAMNDADSRKLLRELCERLTDAEAGALAKECGWLPLSLRLAGSFLADRDDLPVADYLTGFKERRLVLLDQGAPDCGELGVAATLELSYQALAPDLQSRWAALSVFPAGFDATAAAAVWEECGGVGRQDATQHQAASPADTQALSELHRLSLLDWSAAETRYSLHDLSREFARDKLGDAPRFSIALRHAQYYQRLLSSADKMFFTPGSLSRTPMTLLERELANITVAWEWTSRYIHESPAVEDIHLGFCTDSGELLAAFLNPTERERLYSQLLKGFAPHSTSRAALLTRYALARALHDRGDLASSERSAALLESVVQHAVALGDFEIEAKARMFLGRHFVRLLDERRALEEQTRAVAAARRSGNRRTLARALNQLARTYLDFDHLQEGETVNTEAAQVAREQGLLEMGVACLMASARGLTRRAAQQLQAQARRELANQAVSLYEEAVTEARRIGTLKILNVALFTLGRVLRIRSLGDDRARALSCFRESLELTQRTGNVRGQAGAYLDIGETLRMLDRHGEAITALRRSLHLQRRAEYQLGEAETLEGLIKIFWRSHPKRTGVFMERCRAIYRKPEMHKYSRQWNQLERWLEQRKRSEGLRSRKASAS